MAVDTTEFSTRPRRSWLRVLAAASVVILGALAVFALAGGEDSNSTALAKSRTLESSADGFTPIPSFTPRVFPAVASVDGSLFVFGGVDAASRDFKLLSDGILVAPDFRSSQTVASPPLSPPLYTPAAVGVGSSVVVVGASCDVKEKSPEETHPVCEPGTYAGAVLDIADGAWRVLEPPRELASIPKQLPIAPLGETSSGRAVFTIGEEADETYWSIDPSDGQWQRIADPPVRPESSCLSGDKLVVLTTSYRAQGKVVADDPSRSLESGGVVTGYLGDGFIEPRIAALDLSEAGAWEVSAPAADVLYPSTAPDVSCLDDGAAVVNTQDPSALIFYSIGSKQWLDAPAAPDSGYYVPRVWTGAELVFLPTRADAGKSALTFQPLKNAWGALAGVPVGSSLAVFTGTSIAGYSEPPPRHAFGDTDPPEFSGASEIFHFDVPQGAGS